jgi:hypothetical protein
VTSCLGGLQTERVAHHLHARRLVGELSVQFGGGSVFPAGKCTGALSSGQLDQALCRNTQSSSLDNVTGAVCPERQQAIDQVANNFGSAALILQRDTVVAKNRMRGLT